MQTAGSHTVNIVWYKRDLRIYDHAPLWHASQAGLVIPLYIVEPDYWILPDTSYRQWSFVHDSLHDLAGDLSALGAALVVRCGHVIEVLESFRHQFKSFTLWSHEETGNDWTFRRDLMVKQWCREYAVLWKEFPSHGVVRGLESRDEWSKLRSQRMSHSPITPPEKIQKPSSEIVSDQLLKDRIGRGGDPIVNPQKGGRREGQQVLTSFILGRAENYLKTISRPGVSARHCSRLSTHIAYGTLSVREIEQKVQFAVNQYKSNNTFQAKNMVRNLEAFLSRLAWRCHFVQKLEQQPTIETHCMHPAFEGMREPFHNEDYFEAWKNGSTGYPLIDACMRSLIANGWITFRMRAMLVSFASYQLWLDWRKTGPYLAKLFTDYEPGIHYSQLQMQSGVTGINAVRIYNPVKQSIEHDPQGLFIRRYVPELADVSNQWIHEPWQISNLPKTYQTPIVEHLASVKNARLLLSDRRQNAGFRERANMINQKLGSRNRPPKPSRRKKSAPQLVFDFDNEKPQGNIYG